MSVSVTLSEVPVPPAVTVSVNVAVAPAMSGPFAVLATETSGRSHATTAIDAAFDVAKLAFDDVAVAMFVNVPQLASVVADVTWTVIVWFCATELKLHVRSPFAIEQPATAGSTDHETPDATGRLSKSTTLSASPGPLFVRAIVYPTDAPAFTVDASALLTMVIAGISALGWMLRSWFLLPAPSSCCVRMCQGAPEI